MYINKDIIFSKKSDLMHIQSALISSPNLFKLNVIEYLIWWVDDRERIRSGEIYNS